MELIVSGLFVWLIVAVISSGYAIFSQVSRMKRFMGATSFNSASSEAARGLGLTVLAAFICAVSTILFLVAVVGSLMG